MAYILVGILSIYSIPPFIDNTFIQWGLEIAILAVIFHTNPSRKILAERHPTETISIFLAYITIQIIWGAINAEMYWDWKGLVGNSMGLLLVYVVYPATDIYYIQTILYTYIRYGIPLLTTLFIALASTIDKASYGYAFIPISCILLYLSIVPKQHVWKILIPTLVVLLADFDARSNVIKFATPIVIGVIAPLLNALPLLVTKILHKLMFLTPPIFFTLAVIGAFNVFNFGDYIEQDGTFSQSNSVGAEDVEVDLKADTRTFLYKESLTSAKILNTWIFGRTPARGNLSEVFGYTDPSGRGERGDNEVGLLNIFNWTGIIGVICYTCIYFHASYLAIHHSNSEYSKSLGLFISFHYIYSWIENFNNFTLGHITLWILIGLGLSRQFRTMNNAEFKNWIHCIFVPTKHLTRNDDIADEQ